MPVALHVQPQQGVVLSGGGDEMGGGGLGEDGLADGDLGLGAGRLLGANGLGSVGVAESACHLDFNVAFCLPAWASTVSGRVISRLAQNALGSLDGASGGIVIGAAALCTACSRATGFRYVTKAVTLATLAYGVHIRMNRAAGAVQIKFRWKDPTVEDESPSPRRLQLLCRGVAVLLPAGLLDSNTVGAVSDEKIVDGDIRRDALDDAEACVRRWLRCGWRHSCPASRGEARAETDPIHVVCLLTNNAHSVVAEQTEIADR